MKLELGHRTKNWTCLLLVETNRGPKTGKKINSELRDSPHFDGRWKQRDSKRRFGSELESSLVAAARNPQQQQERRGKTQERGAGEETTGTTENERNTKILGLVDLEQHGELKLVSQGVQHFHFVLLCTLEDHKAHI